MDQFVIPKKKSFLRRHGIAILFAVLAVLIVVGTLLYIYFTASNTEEIVISSPSIENTTSSGDSDINTSNTSTSTPETVTIPSKVNIDVPFLVQAPNANWDALHQEACEEASLIMLRHFLNGTDISTDQGESEIQELIAWEGANGYKIDVTVAELNAIARDYYGITSGRIKTGITIDDIKWELAAGRPVIIPAAGKLLPNPNFRNGGPVYHMLVIRGYDKNGFITNDPGTRKGEEFRYTFDALYNAIHDWSVPDILQGQKAYLVFDK